jgi:hypothetical protein
MIAGSAEMRNLSPPDEDGPGRVGWQRFAEDPMETDMNEQRHRSRQGVSGSRWTLCRFTSSANLT